MDDNNDNPMKTFMKMFMMQSESDRIDQECEHEDRPRQEEVDREERRFLQMAQAKATLDMTQLMLMHSMGTNASATTDTSGAYEKSGVKKD